VIHGRHIVGFQRMPSKKFFTQKNKTNKQTKNSIRAAILNLVCVSSDLLLLNVYYVHFILYRLKLQRATLFLKVLRLLLPE
jgi:hypothetical protein